MRTLIPIFLSIFLLFSCTHESKVEEKEFSVISYNIQTFFDDDYLGNEFSGFLKEDGWNSKKYINRLNRLRETIKRAEFSSADIIFFQEIENERILEDLLDLSLNRRGFKYYGITNSNSPISVGYISKIYVNSANSHIAGSGREVIDLEVFIGGHQIRLISLHAKSNLGGKEETEEERLLLSRLLNQLIIEYEGIPMVITGDFNCDPIQLEIQSIMQADYYDIDYLQEIGALLVTGNSDSLNNSTLYSPYLDINFPIKGSGTYYYDNEWYNYDHVFFSKEFFEFSNLKFKDFQILNIDFLTKNNKPFRYDLKSEEGYSDHFAVKGIFSYH